MKQELVAARVGMGAVQQGQQQNLEWTNEESKALEAAVARYPAEKHTLLERSVRISATLKNKTARDVALRIMWAQRRDLAKKAKKEASERTAKSNLKRERSGSIFAVQAQPTANGVTAASAKPNGGANGADGSKDVSGSPAEMAQLLDSNFHIIGQIRENMKWFKVNENTELLVRMRDNTIKILQHMGKGDGVMAQMPPLPVKMNLELANNFLPKVLGQAPQLQPQVMLQMAPHQVQMPAGGALHAIPAQAMNIPAHQLQMHQQVAQAAGFSQALQQQQAINLKMVHNISTTLGMAVGGVSAPMIMQMAAPMALPRPQ